MTFDLPSLRSAYADGADPCAVIDAVYAAIAAWNDPSLFLHLRPRDAVLAEARVLRSRSRDLPLFGVPFAIKDNIDLAGVPTTAACPSYAYTPKRSATVVDRLIAAGAIAIGKTNLDQFATGLVGARSPAGTPRNPFHADYVPGGSSSGSACAVSAGLVSFALGTDTAGSGRVPASFQNLVGLKPTRGWLSTRGVVPAARTCDCVSIFALSVGDAWTVATAAAAYDREDPYSRAPLTHSHIARRIGIPGEVDLDLDSDDDRRVYREACQRLKGLGYALVPIDYQILADTAKLLYEGAFVAERTHAIGSFLDTDPVDADPSVARIIRGGSAHAATTLVADQHRLQHLRRQAEGIWAACDLVCLPTTPGIPTCTEVAADPLGRNRRLGTYTNWMNLLDCCGLAIPAGWSADGLPIGVTVAAPAWNDAMLAQVGSALHHRLGGTCGRTNVTVPKPLRIPQADTVRVVVVGAHLSGLPLNHQLTERGAVLEVATQTAPMYRLYALPDTSPPKPGLHRVAHDGVSVACEIWRMPLTAYGSFVAAIPAPLSIGSIALVGGDSAQGFLCESWALTNATDISACGGWRTYLAQGLRA